MISKDELKRMGACAPLLPEPANHEVSRLVNSHLEAYAAMGEECAKDFELLVWIRQQISQELAWLRANKERFDSDLYQQMESRWALFATAHVDTVENEPA